MAPPAASSRTVATKTRRPHQIPDKSVGECKASGTATSSLPSTQTNSANTPRTDTELVKDFKSDLQTVRALVTCTICDQLLYEPWTLSCGHTYCYSCLCSWFLPNKRKKTCPDCRAPTGQMPAPAFLIKQMIDIFVDRTELMPLDESADQHRERKISESCIVEADRICESGLFKGCFNSQPPRHIQFDEADRIPRCAHCSQEYLGGPTCENCGVDFEGQEDDSDIGEGFSDYSVDFDDDVDLGSHSDDEDEDLEPVDRTSRPEFWSTRAESLSMDSENEEAVIQWHHSRSLNAHDSGMVLAGSSNSDISEDDEETESMRDFVEEDEEPGSHKSPNSASHVSLSSTGPDSVSGDNINDESSDEGGAVSNGRRRGQAVWMSARGTHPIVTITDSANTSESGDLAEESRRLQESGWSPLEQEAESEFGEHQPFVGNHGESDTDTTVADQASDEEDDDRYRESSSVTPVWGQPQSETMYFGHPAQRRRPQSSTTDEQSDIDGYESELHGPSLTDQEGDVEMSLSPVSSRSNSTAGNVADRRPRRSVEILGSATAIHEIQDDSSDGTVQPAVRRRRQSNYPRHSNAPEYDPRISMMFAQHQLDLQDVTARESPYFDPSSRSRHTTSYRVLPPRGAGSTTYHHPSSTVILTSVSSRPNRVQRQYPRRYFN